MSDGIELEPKLRAELDALHARLDELDHYALLGIARDADRKAIKAAYYAYVARIHPDRHFGKSLGDYKSKMEVLFDRMTTAHDTLAAAQRRADYDAYLAERDRTTTFEQVVSAADERNAQRLASVAARPPAPAPPAAARTPAPPVAARTPTPPAPPVAARTPTPPPLSPEAERLRREALARRLLGNKSAAPPARSTSTASMSAVRPTAHPPPHPTSPPTSPSISTPTPTPFQMGVEAIVQSARTAAEAGDYVTASTRMRLAAKLDASLNAEAERFTALASEIMAEAYVKRARYEESEGQWVSAAISWGKAAEGLPADATVAERAANALRRARGDLHKAVRFAETAVRLSPNDAQLRLTLVEVYLDAGLLRRARAELDPVLRVMPRDARARQLDLELQRRA